MNHAYNSSLCGDYHLKNAIKKKCKSLVWIVGWKAFSGGFYSSGRKHIESCQRPERKGYFLKRELKNSFMSCQDSLSAFASYAIGRLNFFPSFVASGLVKL